MCVSQALFADRSYHLKKYPDCMVGSEGVSWLLDHLYAATRPEATQLLQDLVASGLLQHVTKGHAFEDKYYFYRLDHEQLSSRRSAQAATGPHASSQGAASACGEVDGGGEGGSSVKETTRLSRQWVQH